MNGMLATAFTEFTCLKPVRMLLLVLGRSVISIFADRALKGNYLSHLRDLFFDLF